MVHKNNWANIFVGSMWSKQATNSSLLLVLLAAATYLADVTSGKTQDIILFYFYDFIDFVLNFTRCVLPMVVSFWHTTNHVARAVIRGVLNTSTVQPTQRFFVPSNFKFIKMAAFRANPKS